MATNNSTKKIDNASKRTFKPTKKIIYPAVVVVVIITIFLTLRDKIFNLFNTFLERTEPTIAELSSIPKGVGLTPITIKWRISDYGAGLEDVAIRLYQKNEKHDLLKTKLNGANNQDIELIIDREKSGIRAGEIELEVAAYDKSFWFNRAEKRYTFSVDFNKPHLNIITTQHNAVLGGSQLAFYEAKDENLAISGVKVGSRTFQGYPAKFLDQDFESMPNLYACIYAIDINSDPKTVAPRLFAEDSVGNTSSISFNNKTSPARYATLRYQLNKDFMKGEFDKLAKANKDSLSLIDDQINWDDSSDNSLRAKFKLLNDTLREMDRDKIRATIRNKGRMDKLWDDTFNRPLGSARSEFGHTINYFYNGVQAGSGRQTGYQLISPDIYGGGVRALNSGIVHSIVSLETYGLTVIIDHGMGIYSLYANLDKASVSVGQNIEALEQVGLMGTSGLAPEKEAQVELWIQSIPVNPREWWDPRWYQAHILDKITSTKKQLGIPVATRY